MVTRDKRGSSEASVRPPTIQTQDSKRSYGRRIKINSRSAWIVWITVLLVAMGGGGWRKGGPSSLCGIAKSGNTQQHSVGYACAMTAIMTTKDDEEKSSSKTRRSFGGFSMRPLQNNTGKVPSRNAVTSDGSPTSTGQILAKAAKRGLGGGLPGAIAGIVQVLSLMWLRTIINYQIRYGVTFAQAFVSLKNDGGLGRFYQGLAFALVQAPLSRFVSTAANDGVNALMASLEATKEWGPERTTLVASIVVGLARILLMPIDTCKTVLQVNSAEGFRSLMRRVRRGSIGVLYQGSIATAVAAFVAHYPWFYTYNLLSSSNLIQKLISSTLLRNATIGFVSSIASDVVVNAIRVIKTTKQSMGSKTTVTYAETISIVLAAGGWKGLFGRGLRTRIYANALQSVVFTVIWRGLAERNKSKDGEEA